MNFPSIRLEGAILTADLLDAIAWEDKHSQKPADFGLDPSSKVKDEIASTWASTKALWTGYQAKIANLHEGQTGVSETRNLFIIPLLALLGYQPEKAEAEIVNGKSYAISHRDISRDGFPLHIMGWHDHLEKKRESGGPRSSAHALVQEYLNLTEHAYGIITNGRQLRLLRDSSRLIKLSFLEFDLNRIFEEDLYADFAILFRLLHATRMPANRANASDSVIEKYHQESVDSGSRIRDGLAAAVAYSMQTVANGLLTHPANANLVDQLKNEPGRTIELHQNLLRWVYRTLFVLVIEERVLHHTPTATLRQRQLYRDYYSLQRLRRLADRPQLADRRSHDLWRAMHQTLRLYEDGGKGLPLGIAPLGSFLFREEGLQQLFQYQLDNRSLLQALNRLSTFTHPDTNVRMRVNYGALDVEEFGSVYESLLALRPRIIPDGEKLKFSYAELAGNERKTSGSYYTPDSLVQCLLDSALDPVIEKRLAGKKGQEAEKALLSIKVCDKAVGSGHFLIGAAHRLARRLAEIRAGEEALSPDVQRHALRDVVSHCLYGVDINPLAVELCKVSLWMLAMEPGKPLSFLDHHIRCGNSLLGATPELIKGGIPDEAYAAIEGDDKEACSALKKKNKRENPKLGEWFAKDEADIRNKLLQAATAIDDMADSRPEDIQRKETAFRNVQQNYDFQKAWDLADLWCAAFVIKKEFPATASETSHLKSDSNPSLDGQPLALQGGLFGGGEELPKAKSKKPKLPSRADSEIPNGITTQHLRDFVEGGALPDGLLAEAKRLADQYQFFHWHLAFPEVFAQGGFDLNLGNPPWVRQELLKPVKQLLPKFRSFTSTADSSVYFMELNVQTCRPSGRVALLTPNKWFRASYADSLRQFLRERCRIVLLIDFGHSRNLFPDADTFPAAAVFEPVTSPVLDSEIASFVQAHDSDREHHTLPDLINNCAVRVPHSNLRPDRWHLEGSGASNLLNRLMATGRPLEPLLRRSILSGLKTGFNDAFYIETPLRDAMLEADPSSAHLFKKFLRGRDVKRWVPFWDDQWHIVIPSSQNRAWPWSNATNEAEAETIFAATHPSIHSHLKQFEQPLRARQDKGKYWWELRACDYYEDFAKPKIIVQCIAYYSQFAFDEQGHYANNKAIVIPTDDLYLLAILNSRIIWWIVNRTFQHMKDEGLSVDVQFLKRLPVPAVGEPLRSEIASLAGEIVAASRSPTDSEQIPSLEMRLNNLVTRAFALTTAEQDVMISSLPPRDPIAELEEAFPAATGAPTESVSDQVPKQAIIPAPTWLDRPLVLPKSRRIGLTPDRYRATVVPHLLYQAGGSVSFERFRKAYWLLTEPKTLERYASGTVGEIARGWARTFRDKLEKDRFIEHLKGAVGRQLHFIHKVNERWLELRDSNVADDEHVIFDARLALLVADLWPVAEPITPLAPAEEVTIQELEAVL